MMASLVRGFPSDLRLAVRRLAATPLFALFAVLSLAMGVGATTAIYSVVDAIFFTDLGVPDPDRLVFVVTPYETRILKGSISQPDFEHLRAAQRSLASLSASLMFDAAVALPSTTELLSIEAVDGGYFTTLGVTTAIGRPILGRDTGTAAHVVVLGDSLWRRRFGGDPGAVGRTIAVGGRPFEIIGVAARPFAGANGPVPGTDLWIPLGADAPVVPGARPRAETRDGRRLLVFGRLAPSATVAAASAEVAAIAAGLDAAFPPPSRARHAGATERPWKARSARDIAGDESFVRRFGVLLVSLVALVLVVACTNLANLVLARGSGRQAELAVRSALGAPRWRLVREQIVESLLLAAGGAAASCLVFQVLRVLMDVEFNLSLPGGGRWILSVRPELDLRAATLAGGSLFISLLVFGLEPALRLTRSCDLRGELAAGLARPTPGRQKALLRWQVAISAGFFIIATMFVKYTIAEARHDSGIPLDRLAVAVLNLPSLGWDAPRVRRTHERLLEEARLEPGVDAIAASSAMPFGTPGHLRLSLAIPGQPSTSSIGGRRAAGVAVDPGFLSAAGVPIVKGRGFDLRDHAASAAVVIVSAFTARTMFGTTDAVGRQLAIHTVGGADSVATVIGVARDTDVGMILGDPRMLAYLPLAQRSEPFRVVTVRAGGDEGNAVRALRNILRRVDPELAVETIGTGRTVLSGPFVFLRAAGLAAVTLGAITLLLAMAGLFGVQSHVVTLRTQEIGVRMSLGATAGRIKTMVLRDGSRPVVEGVAIGLFIGIAGRAIVRAYMDIDVHVVDLWMLAVVPLPIVLAGLCACYFPARRAASVDPNVALRRL